MANFRSTSLIHFGWLTTDYPYKQATSAFNLASQFCQLLSNYCVQTDGRSNTTGARFFTQPRMFVECKRCEVNQRRWTKVGHRQLVQSSTPLITSVERNCLHGSLLLNQPCWSTWGTRVNAPLGVFLVRWSSRWSWSVHLFLGRPMFLRPLGSYCSTWFGSLFVSILCTCCGHFFWYCFISFTVLPFFA